MNQASELRELLDPSRPPKAVSLIALSDVEADELAGLREQLPSAPVERRRLLAQRLVDLGEDDATLNFESVFALLLDDEDAEVRRLAIEGLWEYEDRSIIAPLVQLFTDDADLTVRASAALSLGRFVVLNEFEAIRPSDNQKIIAALRAVIEDPTQPFEVRRRAVEAAGASTEPWVQAMIWHAFDDPEPVMQASALHAMGRNGDSAWLSTLYEEMQSGDPQRRFEAAGAAGHIGDEDAVPYLADLFGDEDPEVQEAAVAAVGEIGGDLAVEALRENLADSEPRLAGAIRAALNDALTGEGLLAPEALDDDLDDDETDLDDLDVEFDDLDPDER
ncbi:MAG: HEAT repeat domain-containing protein [Dehalococcoidia bacterium]